MDPRCDVRPALELRELLEHAHEHVLREVVRLGVAAEHVARDAPNTSAEAVIDLTQRGDISPPATLDHLARYFLHLLGIPDTG